MRWNTPQPGDRRTVTRFAWLPVKLRDGVVCWLEWYSQDQIYDSLWLGFHRGWTDPQWK